MSILSVPNNLLSREELLLRLEEAEETLRAIRSGEVDALVVSGAQGDQVFTLKDATLPYQILIEEMNEGALTLNLQGLILYCNTRFAEMLGAPMQTILGQSFIHFVIPGDQAKASELLERRPEGKSRGELALQGSQAEVPVGISLNEIRLDGELRLGMVITDLTGHKQAEAELRRSQEGLEVRISKRTHELKTANEALRASRRAAINLMQDALSAQEQLDRSNQKLNQILASIQDDFYVLDRDWNFVYASRLFTLKVGKEPEEFVGNNIWKMFPKHVGTVLEENFHAAMEKREIRRFEIGGKYTAAWYSMTAFPSPEGIAVLGTDITQRKLAEDALRQSEERLRRFYESGLIGVLYWNMDGEITDANDKFLEMTGFTREDLANRRIDWVNMTPPEYRHLDENSMAELMATGVNAAPFEKEYIRKDGTRIPVIIAGAMLDETRFNGVAFVLNITERKKAEKALLEASLQKQAAQYARTLIEVSIDPLVTISPEGKITDVNEATVKATGVSREELVGTDFSSYFTEPEKAERGYRQVFAQGFVTDYPLTIRHRDGHLMDVLYNASLYKDAHGSVLGVFAAARDVTARKQASQYARTLLEVSLDPLVTISPEGKITDVNEATVKATGVSREELVGTDFSSYFTEPEKAERGYKQVFAQGFVTDYPLTIRRRDGHLMDVLYNASLYKDAHGNVLGVFAAARDVTAQKRAETELKRHKENLEILVRKRTSELEEANRELARSNENLEQFAYVASHDLQEPLRVMSSFSQLLEKRYKGKLDGDADEFIGFIVDAAARMQKLINDLLAYSRAGRDTTDTVAVDCNQLMRGLAARMAVTIESAGGCVTFDSLPVLIAHETSLIQLFQNLIGNALKFRGEQPPRVHVSARQEGREWVFSVRDNGIGIEPQYSQRIFMIFQRLHTRKQYPGTGIGLSICKKIVDSLGGRIWVESEPGQGSTFYFTVPVHSLHKKE